MSSIGSRSPFANDQDRYQAIRFGMWLFLLTVGMVFLTVILAYVIVRLQLIESGDWRPDGAPGLSVYLTLSTVLVCLISLALHATERSAAQGGDARQLGSRMLVCCLLAGCFIVSQLLAWWDLADRQLVFDESLYAWTFYILTGLHALHVLAGVPSLALTTRSAFQGRYGRTRVSRAGLAWCSMYWHALDVIWIMLFFVLIWGTRAG